MIKNFINGEFVDAQSKKTLDSFNPATGKAYMQQPDSDAIDMVLAIQSASKAFEFWSNTPSQERAKIMFKIADLLESRLEEFAQAESEDVGKPLWLARQADIPRAVLNFRFFASKLLTKEEMSVDLDGKAHAYSLRQPIGVCGLITPWNLPLYLLTWKLAPCIAMGNTAVCKPSEVTPRTAHMFAQLLSDAGLPPGVCNIIFGRGNTAGATLVSHPGVPLISFTGGTETGVKISELAAPQFKKVSLELGGKNANIVFKDADIKRAVTGSVRAAFLNSGQICLCGSRLLVQQDIYEEFMAEFCKQVAEIVVGDPKDEKTFMGPLVSEDQLNKVTAAVAQAKSENAKISFGGNRVGGEGYYFQPTIVEELNNCSDIWQTEIFGPVVTVMPFKYEMDAVKWANTSSYGLAASIWTSDISRGHKVAAKIQAGNVWVNTWMMRDLRVPFGGMKHSGIGREGGDLSLDFYSETKTICVGLA